MRYYILIGVALCMMIATGCNRAPGQDAASEAGRNIGNVKVKQTEPVKREVKDAQGVADRLATIAAKVPQVNRATCVVMGNTAIVGINVDADLDRPRVGTIKYTVAEALRKDPYGAYAIVTADIDLFARLQEIRSDINNGRPVAGFAEELADIVGRIVPQLPKDVLPQDNKEPLQSKDRKSINKKSL